MPDWRVPRRALSGALMPDRVAVRRAVRTGGGDRPRWPRVGGHRRRRRPIRIRGSRSAVSAETIRR
jgi:hypothetical protein